MDCLLLSQDNLEGVTTFLSVNMYFTLCVKHHSKAHKHETEI